MCKLAIIQIAPVVLDRERTLALAVNLVDRAVAEGAELVVFPEAFIAGYPAWVWRLRPGTDWGLSEACHSRALDSAVDLQRGDLQPLAKAAERHGVTILCGMHEKDAELSRVTLYNTYVVIGADGRILNRHRKLMPTNPERMIWGFGDASGLKVIDTPCGRIGSLICWENYMPLARYALYAQGIEIYVAPTYDSGDAWIGTLRHIALEGGCWVVGSGNALRGGDMPDDLPGKDMLYADAQEWVNPGDSIVIAPGGEIVAGPMHQEQGILYADLDTKRIANARRCLDVAGHYARPDIFRLHVDTRPQSPIEFQ